MLEENLDFNISLKTPDKIDEAAEFFTKHIRQATWQNTPEQTIIEGQKYCPPTIREKINNKRRLRKKWFETRAPGDKTNFNRAP